MAIELNINNVTTVVTDGAELSKDQGAVKSKKLGSVLGGANVTVTSGAMSDLEKLVAQLKNATDATKLSVAQTRISVLSTVLDSMKDRVTEKEREAFVQLEMLNGERSEAADELADLTSKQTLLAVKIAELDSAIARAVQEGEDHREQVETLKKQRAEDQEKLDRINTAIESVNTRIAGIDVKIAECTQTIAQTTLNEVADALRKAASSAVSSSSTDEVSDMSDADRVRKEKKEEATDVGNVIRESLDKITEQILSRLAEAQELVKA